MMRNIILFCGIGHEKGFTRRDPSDVIKVDDTWYWWTWPSGSGVAA